MTRAVTLINGREVLTDSPDWAAECLERRKHVQNLLAMSAGNRERYLASLAQAQGTVAAQRVRERLRLEVREQDS